MSTAVTARLPRATDADGFESILLDVAPGTGLVRVDLRQYKFARVFAEARLLGLLARARAVGSRIHVELPVSRDTVRTARSGKYADIFRASALGIALVQMADSVVDMNGTDVRGDLLDTQYTRLRDTGGFLGTGQVRTAIAIDTAIGSPPVDLDFWESGIDTFRPRFVSRLVRPLGDWYDYLSPEQADRLIWLTYEAVSNTNFHGRTDLLDCPISGVRFVLVRRVSGLDQPLIQLLGDGKSPYSQYYRHLLDTAGKEPDHLIEFTVADSGIGIPARFVGDAAIYESSVEEERVIVQKAVRRGSSSRQSGTENAGHGLPDILDAIRFLRGLFVLRTGRSYLYRYYQAEWVSGAEQTEDADTDLLSWPFQGGLVAGTSISVLVPVWTSGRPKTRDQLPMDLW